MSELTPAMPVDSPSPPAQEDRPVRKLELAEEVAVYRKRLPEFLREHEGEYVLIKNQDVIGFYSDRVMAQREAYTRFGVVPFFIRQIAKVERVYYLPNVVP